MFFEFKKKEFIVGFICGVFGWMLASLVISISKIYNIYFYAILAGIFAMSISHNFGSDIKNAIWNKSKNKKEKPVDYKINASKVNQFLTD